MIYTWLFSTCMSSLQPQTRQSWLSFSDTPYILSPPSEFQSNRRHLDRISLLPEHVLGGVPVDLLLQLVHHPRLDHQPTWPSFSGTPSILSPPTEFQSNLRHLDQISLLLWPCAWWSPCWPTSSACAPPRTREPTQPSCSQQSLLSPTTSQPLAVTLNSRYNIQNPHSCQECLV